MAELYHGRHVPVVAAREVKIPKSMTVDEAALIMQKIYRGHTYRKEGDVLLLSHKIHLGYEVRVMGLRAKRKALASGFVQHVINLALLVTVFFLQSGGNVQTRYTLVETLKSYVGDLETPSGVTFDSVSTGDDVWDWTVNALFAEGSELEAAEGGTRVSVRTYNQIVGSVRIETTRVSDDSCAYKHSGWTKSLLKSRRPALWDSEQLHPECFGYGPSESSPFGPRWDDAKWSSSEPKSGGEPRYVVDLGKDPTYARLKLTEMKKEDFFSESTRTAAISCTVYNNALPMLSFVRLLWTLSPTGQLTSRFVIRAMPIQEYMEETFYVQIFLEVLLVWWTLWNIAKELMEVRGMMRARGGAIVGLLHYAENFWNVIDWVRSLALLVVMSRWVWLLLDTSRDIDLDTKRFVDLEEAALVFRDYTLVYNVIVIMSLFSVLQYTALDDRMALLTRSIYESMSDLVPFMTLFLAFVLVFGIIGHLLCAPPRQTNPSRRICTADPPRLALTPALTPALTAPFAHRPLPMPLGRVLRQQQTGRCCSSGRRPATPSSPRSISSRPTTSSTTSSPPSTPTTSTATWPRSSTTGSSSS